MGKLARKVRKFLGHCTFLIHLYITHPCIFVHCFAPVWTFATLHALYKPSLLTHFCALPGTPCNLSDLQYIFAIFLELHTFCILTDHVVPLSQPFPFLPIWFLPHLYRTSNIPLHTLPNPSHFPMYSLAPLSPSSSHLSACQSGTYNFLQASPLILVVGNCQKVALPNK